MKYLIAIGAFLYAFLSSGQIQFDTKGLEEALAQAKTEQKLVFLEAYATWSEPSQLLEKYAFSDLEVSNYFNDNFINIKLDMETYPGFGIAETYNITIYPTVIFINADGEVVHRGCGAMDAGELLDLAKAATGEANWAAMTKSYKNGNREGAFLLNYLALMEDGCLNAEGFAQKLLSNYSQEDLTKENAFLLIEEYQWDIYSREFEYLANNQAAFEEVVGKVRVQNKLFNTFLAQYQEIYVSEELHVFGMRALLDRLGTTAFDGADTLQTMAQLHYTEITEDWKNFATYAVKWMEMSKSDDPEEINEIAWKFYLFVDNIDQLKKASQWVKTAVDNTPIPSLIDTYASLTFKLGNKKKAIELEKQAITMAIELGEPLDHYEHQLKTFQKD